MQGFIKMQESDIILFVSTDIGIYGHKMRNNFMTTVKKYFIIAARCIIMNTDNFLRGAIWKR